MFALLYIVSYIKHLPTSVLDLVDKVDLIIKTQVLML